MARLGGGATWGTLGGLHSTRPSILLLLQGRTIPACYALLRHEAARYQAPLDENQKLTCDARPAELLSILDSPEYVLALGKPWRIITARSRSDIM